MANGIILRALIWLSCLCFARVDAWDGAGHDRIGHITRHMFGKQRKHHIEHMIGSDLLSAASWEEQVSGQYPATQVLHWHKQMPEWGCTGRSGIDIPGAYDGTLYCDDASAAHNSMFCAMQHFWEKIEQNGAPSNLSAKVILKRGTLTVLYDLDKLTAYTIPASFKWFINLLGDAHQPLHWLRGDATYGQDVKVNFKGKHMSLLEVWENHILTYPDWRNEDWNAVRDDYHKLDASWNSTAPTDLLQQWCQDVAKRVCPDIYRELGEPDENGEYILGSQTVLKWIRLGRELAILAGQRIAHLLHFIYRQVQIRRFEVHKQLKEVDRLHNTTTTTMTDLTEHMETFEPPDLGALDYDRIAKQGRAPLEDFAEVDTREQDLKGSGPTKDDQNFDYDKFWDDKPQVDAETLVKDQRQAEQDWEHPELLHPRVEV